MSTLPIEHESILTIAVWASPIGDIDTVNETAKALWYAHNGDFARSYRGETLDGPAPALDAASYQKHLNAWPVQVIKSAHCLSYNSISTPASDTAIDRALRAACMVLGISTGADIASVSFCDCNVPGYEEADWR